MNRKPTWTRKLTLELLEDRSLLTAGFLDPTFAGDGVVTTNVGLVDVYEKAWDVAVYPGSNPGVDGKIVAVGNTANRVRGGYNYDFALVRYNPDGSLDGAFGTGGKVTTEFRGTDEAYAVALVGNKILAAGTANDWADFALARYNDNGTLDATFGGKGKGKVTTGFSAGSTDHGLAMKVQENGRIVVAGTSDSNLALVRYTAAGALDSSFGTGGKVVTSTTVSSIPRHMDMAIYPSTSPDQAGKIVVVSRSSGILIARYTSAGVLDSTFDGDGMVRIDNPNFADGDLGLTPSLTIQADGRIVVAYHVNSDIHLTRFNTDGSLDLSFGSRGTGTAVADLPATYEQVSAVVTDPSGRILVSGQHGVAGTPPNNFFVARFLPDGSLDATFGNGGIGVSSGVNLQPDTVALALQANGKIVLASASRIDLPNGFNEIDFAVARFQGDAALTATASASDPVPQMLAVGEVQPLLEEAVSRWQAPGIDISARRTVDIRIADLGGATLGLASGSTIWLDDDAAGWGWYVDKTPWDDSEFMQAGNQGEQERIDLLSVVMHEMGHVLGHDHDAEGVMAETLATGVRSAGLEHGDGALADHVFGLASEQRADARLSWWLYEQYESALAPAKRRR